MDWHANSLLEGKILIIDDEQMIRQSISAHLDDGGFEVLEATTAQEGLSIFRAEHPDLVITDIQMPDMRGLELLPLICAEAPDIPIIVISGVGVMEDVVKALRLGAWDYLIKPIADLTVLEHAVCKCLERARLLKENHLYRAELEEKNIQLKESLAILEEDQAAGHSVQTSLLPEKEHTFHSYTISQRMQPSFFLSADFVDFFEIDSNHLGFYIADVSGHGASSAFVTVLLKSIVDHLVGQYQSHHADTILHPDQVLAHLSKAIYNAKLGKYLTMVYCVLSLDKNDLCYAIGGHYPYPIIKTETTCDYIENKGFPVGIFDKVVYQAHTVLLPESFTFVMFSDGVLEIFPDKNLEDKEKKLLELVRTGGMTADSIFDTLGISKLVTIPDDITLLVLNKQKDDLAANIRLGIEEKIGILQLNGELRFDLAPTFDLAFKELTTIFDLQQCIVDLGRATLIDSTIFGMIGALLELKKIHPGLILSLAVPQESMRNRVLHLHFDAHFRIIDTAPLCSQWLTFSKKSATSNHLQGFVQKAHEKLMAITDANDYQLVLETLKKE